MNKHHDGRDKNELVRYGNSFPWAGILAGVWRMAFYLFLSACLLVVLAAVVLLLLSLVDSEPLGDYF
jgi:hypothetical protein